MSTVQIIGLVLFAVTFMTAMIIGFMVGRDPKRQRECFHHDHTHGYSYITSEMVDAGRAKRYTCSQKNGGCGKAWVW
jgi:hypothetical protein